MAVLPPDKLVPAAALEAYLMDPTPFPWGALLAPVSPPLPRAGEVRLASFFGDVFVEDEHGAIWWVNPLEERVERIAINLDKAIERINREHLTMLKTKLIEAMIVSDKLLPTGMLYGLKTPRAEGGRYHPDNIGTASVADSFAYLGARFQAKHAPAMPPEPPAADPKSKSSLWGKNK